MLKYSVKALVFMAALVLSGAAFAVSMGDINVTTALGQPLKAEIGLTDLGKGGKSKISVKLASPEAFKEAGLEYPATLPKLKFQIESRASGEAYLGVTSTDPVNEPFVDMLIELNWPSGKLLRQYTFLLDPPGFRPEQPKPEQVQALEPSVASAPEPKAEPAAPEAMQEPVQEEPKPVAKPQPEEMKPAAPVAKPAPKPEMKSNVASGTIEVKKGDTLSKIARETKPADVSLERMLVAMYHANEDQFDGHNMNRIRTGKILRVPETDELDTVEQAEAVQEIRAQVADWHTYRQRLAAASASSAEQAPRQEVSGKINTSVSDKSPPAMESRDVVRLSKGEAPGDKVAADGKSMQDKLHAMQEEAIARDKMLKDSHARIAMLEKNIKEMQRLLELKGQPVPSVPEQAKPAAKPEAAKPAPVEVKPLAPAKPVQKPVQKPAHKAAPPPPPPPSLIDEILGEPLYMGGIAAAVLVLLGGGFVLLRRRGKGGKKPAKVEEDKLADTGTHIAEPVTPSPDTGDFTASGTLPPAAPGEPEDVDPIKEADLFLSFGRDAQAEEILKDALEKHPDNQEVRVKLLSIYANRKDVNKFSAIAQQVQDSGDAAAWEQTAEMGRKIDPGNPMYGGSEGAEAGEMPDDESTITQASTSLDFDLGTDEASEGAAEEEVDVPVDTSEDTASGLDFDLGSEEPEEAAVPEAEAAVTEEEPEADTSVMDFDLGLDQETEPEPEAESEPEPVTEEAPVAEEPPVEEEALAEEESKPQDEEVLDFDITAQYSGLGEEKLAEEQAEEPMPSADDLVFDVTGIQDAPATEEAAQEPEEPSLEAEEPAPEAEEPALEMPEPEEPESEEAISLDIPLEEPAAEEEVAPEPESEPVQEPPMDLSEISLDIGEPAEAAESVDEAKDQRWHDVATKLDLARAYQEMGDAAGAKEILDEVMAEGDAQQKATAQAMIQQLSL